MSPGLGPEGIEVVGELISAKSLMCAENLFGCSFCGGFSHKENTAGFWWIIFAGAVLVNSIVLDH